MDIGKYNPQEKESGIYKVWIENNVFRAETGSNKKTYTIVIPPPNVTGVLHMGHGLNNTIQDILIRWKKMQGYETLWVPGTDHAGIATQNVVEKDLWNREEKRRDDIGRDEFLKLVWEWKEKNGNFIIEQLKRLGSSCDWSRTRFTMDEGLSNAVKDVFIRLYKKNLIYRGSYIINWCPRCGTALADEEVDHLDKNGKLYHIKYPFADGSGEVVVATTRPETMLGDTAVAVNPSDDRYKKYYDKKIILPVVDREIPIIKDDFVDIEFGTGCVKVTPAHDPNDYEMALRHDLEKVVVIDEKGNMTDRVPGKYRGLDRFSCRKELVKDLEEKGYMIKIEDYSHSVGHCYRCNTVVEPYLSKQWFVKMKPLAKKAIEVVEKGEIRIYPERWKKVYMNWMTNIRDWCISRQIWWGHRIPVWYCNDCGEEMVFMSELKECSKCKSNSIIQDNDVLDTWFSSWLWPFSTLGWPEDTDDLKSFYPTNTLVTDPGIIFFWVARMIMAGLEFTGKIPFSDVYIHGTVMDSQGRKMSKSLGNGIDPIDVIKEYGADALRYTIVSITPPGQNTLLSMEKFNTGKYFANKIWNASRFIFLNYKPELDKGSVNESVVHESVIHESGIAEKWILHNMNLVIKNITDSLNEFRFNEALLSIYSFFWHSFCDWYLEIAKIDFTEGNDRKIIVLTVLMYVFRNCLKLLHPFMPFITEELWQKMYNNKFILEEKWPEYKNELVFEKDNAQFKILQEVVTAVRNIKSSFNIKLNERLQIIIQSSNNNNIELLKGTERIIRPLMHTDDLQFKSEYKKESGTASAVVRDLNIYIPLKGVIDIDKEKKRLEKKRDDLITDFKRTEAKIKNKKFINNAPSEIVEKEENKYKEFKLVIEKLENIISDLEDTGSGC